jgi:hypothetical protein
LAGELALRLLELHDACPLSRHLDRGLVSPGTKLRAARQQLGLLVDQIRLAAFLAEDFIGLACFLASIPGSFKRDPILRKKHVEHGLGQRLGFLCHPRSSNDAHRGFAFERHHNLVLELAERHVPSEAIAHFTKPARGHRRLDEGVRRGAVAFALKSRGAFEQKLSRRLVALGNEEGRKQRKRRGDHERLQQRLSILHQNQ